MGRLGRAAVAVLAVGAAAGCGSSGYHYVKSSSNGSFLKVPEAWHLYDGDDYFRATGDAAITGSGLGWAVAFDASRRPDLANVMNLSAAEPAGVVRIRPITTFDDHDRASYEALRNLDFPVDRLVSQGDAEVVGFKELRTDSGYKGARVVFRVRNSNGRLVTIDQTAYYDPDVTKVYSLTFGCSTQCYDDHFRTIDRVVGSWRLVER
jgi:hypothetical protein